MIALDRTYQIRLLTAMVSSAEHCARTLSLEASDFEDSILIWAFQEIRGFYDANGKPPTVTVLRRQLQTAAARGVIKRANIADHQKLIDEIEKGSPPAELEHAVSEGLRFLRAARGKRALLGKLAAQTLPQFLGSLRGCRRSQPRAAPMTQPISPLQTSSRARLSC